MNSATRHDLHVGGSCRSGWRTTGVVTLLPDGSITGRASARLEGWSCDFPVAQVQTRTVQLSVAGRASGGQIDLRFIEEAVAPTGSQDLGGFTATLHLLAPSLEVPGNHGDSLERASRPDGDLGRYVNDSKVQLNCASAC